MRRHLIKYTAALLLLTVLLSALPFHAHAESEPDSAPEIGEFIQVMYDDAGLLSNEANTILHSRNGYIWIGSYSGLARYDSTSVVTYGDDDHSLLNGVSVRTLFEDKRGRMWIGSNEKGVYYYENGEFFRPEIDPEAISGSIRAFAETDAGIYVASTGGIILINEQMEVHQMGFADISSSHVVDMLTDNDGNLWIVDNNSVAALAGHKLIFNADMTQYTSYECNCISQLKDGRFLVGTSGNEVISFTPSGSGYAVDKIFLDDRRTSDKNVEDCMTINCILEDSYGRIWICADTGLGYIENSAFYVANGINLGSLEHIEIDYEGNLWLASSRHGVLQLVQGRFNDKSMSTALHGVTVNATQIYENLLFAATDSGVQVLNPKTFEAVSHPIADLLEGIRVRGLFVDSRGYLWITTYAKYGAVRYKDGQYVSITTEHGLTSNKTRVAMELPNGDIAIATGGGVSIIRDTTVIKTYTEEDGLVNPVILSMCMDKAGNMYFGSDGNGLYVISPKGEFRCFTSADGLGSDVILNLKYDEKMHAVWISTGSALSYWDEEGIHNLEDFTAGTGSIFDILFIDDTVWILRNTSVIVTTREQLLSGAPTSEYTVLSKKDGLIDVTANSRHFIDSAGNLFLATSNGVYTISTVNLDSNDINHKAIINTVYVDGKEYVNPTSVVLPASTNRLTIEFSALNYSTDSCTVEYQLIGADDKPIRVSGDKALTRDYTNLRGGNYVFRVAVVNSSGVTSEHTLELNIRKQLAFWEHLYFIICAIVMVLALLAGVVFAAVQIRTAALVKRQERYRSLTESALRVAARSIDAKDSYTNGHSTRVAVLSREIARRLGWSEERIENVYYTALVHDIGKIGVPDTVLTKPSKLTDEEYEIIRTHTTMGYNILKEFEGVPDIELGARYHHERFDGNGYCEKLKGEEIPLVARVIAVADAYDAMSSSRVYRAKLSPEQAREEIERCKGTQFDPDIADIMLKMLDDGFDPFKEEDGE